MTSRPSSAIKIVAPSVGSSSTPPPPDNPTKKKESQRQCRNILIHGHCKFEGRGCIYQHPPKASSSNADQESDQTLNINVNAPVFVPKASGSTVDTVKGEFVIPPSFTPPLEMAKLSLNNGHTHNGSAQVEHVSPITEQDIYQPTESLDMNAMLAYESPMHASLEMTPEGYYATAPAVPHPFVRTPLDYHLYAPPKQTRQFSTNHYITPSLHEDLTKRSEAMHFAPPPLSYTGVIPEEVSGYVNVVPLDSPQTRMGNWTVGMWRGVHQDTGEVCLLRRVENFRLPHEQAFQTIASWKRVKSPNVINVHEAFTTRAWGDSSLVLVYDYHPTAINVVEEHLRRPQPPIATPGKRTQYQTSQQQGNVDERTLWSYIIQVACGIKSVHDAGLAVRSLGAGDGSEVWVTTKNRVRIGGAGLWDVLGYDPSRHVGSPQEMGYMQQEDLLAFGKLIMTLASPSSQAQHIHNPNSFQLPKLIETIGRTYSVDVKNVVLWCISKPSPHKVVAQLFDMIGSRLLGELDATQLRGDSLEEMLLSELENARLVRLVCKMGFINERPEFDHEPRWSETGDRYIIKLFRDYVFHQVNELGRPVVDLGHVVTCLNKLDAGSEERIMLVSRDEQSCLVVSYKDVKACIDGAFRDLGRTR